MYGRQGPPIHHAHSAEGPAQLRIHHLGAHPILHYYLQQMDLCGIIRGCLGAARQGVVDHGEVIGALIHNLVLSPGPLYRLAEWLAPIEPEALGLRAQQVAAINDDRAARALEALASRRGRNVFFRLALRIIRHFQLDISRVHFDTTSVSFYGEYNTSNTEPRISRGHSKDHRPDLKQLVFGLNVAGDGAVPLSHGVFSGNRSDDTLHRDNWQGLKELLGRSDFIYVADSKLCTKDNLAVIAGHGGRFVTVLPRSRREDQSFRATLRQQGARWRKLLELPGRRLSDPPDIYSTCRGPSRTEDGFRLIWVRSSAKARLDAQRREQNVEQARRELLELSGKLNRARLKKPAAIKAAAQAILRKHRCPRFLKVSLLSQKVVSYKRLRPGRPKPDDPLREVIKRRYRIHVDKRKEALKQERRTDGVFPLVSNLDKKVPKKRILLIYKYQPYLEKRFALLKSEFAVAPVYLKKPLRVAGLIHAYFIAMILSALIERQLRRAMKMRSIEQLPLLPEGRETKTPTTARILEAFQEVKWFEFEGARQEATFPVQLSPLQEKLLELLQVPQAVYL